MNDFEYIKGCVSREDLLLQLAEEAAELAQAALKLHRKIIGTNPTPKTFEECKSGLIEETADVDLCLNLLGMYQPEPLAEYQRIMAAKTTRWANRLKGNPCATCNFKNRLPDQEPCCRCDERLGADEALAE